MPTSTNSGPKVSSETSCKGCGQKFSSRNKMFKHLQATDGACLSKEDYLDFCKYVRKQKHDKVLILFGYLPFPSLIKNGDDAARLLIKAIQQWENQVDGISNESDENNEPYKFNRSYGNDQRCMNIVAQDEDTGAITELVSVRLQPLRKDTTGDQFLDAVQAILDKQFASQSPVPIRILGRQGMADIKFNAELDVTHRRIEYVLPIDFLSWSCSSTDSKSRVEALPSFSENHKHNMTREEEPDFAKPDMKVRTYLYNLKKLMQMLSTQIVELDMSDKAAVMEKGFSLQKRKAQSKKSNRRKQETKGEATSEAKNGESEGSIANAVKTEGQKILKRKRFHNFTETVMGKSTFIRYGIVRLLNFSPVIPHTNIST
jgi:hypothetical protein